jgi:hypothetical protein
MRHDPNASGPIALRPSHRLFVTLAVAVCLIAGVLVVIAPPASATSGWSIVPSPRPKGWAGVTLGGVSCPSTTNCFAVGSAGQPNSTTVLAFLQHWNGHTWSIMTSPKPKGAQSLGLSGVSCSTTTSCFAVGSYQTGVLSPLVTKTLVEHWNGQTWSIMPSPNPTGSANSFLNGVSCRGTSCFAVGYSRLPHSTTLVEHWVGNRWSIVPSPNPTGSLSDDLGGVSCPSTTNCFAVGNAQFGSDYKTLMEHWNGHIWSIMTSPSPAGSDDGFRSGVSCPSTASCYAVGTAQFGAGYKTLIEHWNGTRWSIMTSPNPKGADSAYLNGDEAAYLNGVSCPTTTHCFAVGESTVVSDVPYVGAFEKTLVEYWNGRTWSIMRSRNPSPGGVVGAALSGVSCHRQASCFAVGGFGGGDIPGTNLIEGYG